MAELEIRAFERAETEAVIALWHRVGLTRPWNDPQKDIERKLQVGPELFLVGCVEGRLVATAMGGYEGHRGWVNYLAVDEAWRGHGFARQLMTYLEARLIEAGCPKINLLVRSDNAAAVAFYEAIGYLPDAAVPLGKRLIPDD